MNSSLQTIMLEPHTWHGQLHLTYSNRQGMTLPSTSYACAPLKLQRPFYPEGPEVCHTVILHTAGGMVGGDRLSLHLTLQPHTHALITTAAAAKIYRSSLESSQTIQITLADHACLEWLPQETIVFNDAIHRQHLRVELAPTSIWMGWEMTRLGRSARGEQFVQGHWRSRTEIWRAGHPLWIDPQWIEGCETVFRSPHGLANQPVIASLAIVGQAISRDLVTQARQLWEHPSPRGEIGVTRLQAGLLCRYRGASTIEARRWFMAVWNLLRLTLLNRSAHPPRIWPDALPPIP
ncbi:urease accessory protein [Leptolyngbya sp. 'hensonii']|uniref:urease accessory protein UreD n=1 Tax=Leptolyngbya sp. 'hensonii' TaxID=1922337 RepID=UPI00094FBA65|nr:urease accessory protein UreD [Leptolyngbya sp. 'hensonii']OLP16181.1 urease accessory protein [Leptolyngbya sp. 'hensonii']